MERRTQLFSNGRSALVIAAALAIVTIASGCDDDDERDAGITADGGDADDAGGPLGDGAVALLSEAEVAGVVIAINAAEIEQAELADTRAVRADVVAFAERMLDEHRAAAAEHEEVLERIGVTPVESSLGRTLQQQAAVMAKKLAELSGAEFDASYVNAQILMHAEALDIVQTRLMPSATTRRYRELLVELRDTLVAHLESARAIEEAIGDGGALTP